MAAQGRAPLNKATAFCKHHLGKRCFAPHTGQDHAAWRAFVYLLELWAYSDHNGKKAAIDAMRVVLKSAQQSQAIHMTFVQAIPAILDWSDTANIWPGLGSPFDIWHVNTGPISAALLHD
jgi:hypothetical protein